ncbi:MAG TPA: PQQ-binding-like beta-propeller repeat protein, partial [Jiangellaceae bacterium]
MKPRTFISILLGAAVSFGSTSALAVGLGEGEPDPAEHELTEVGAVTPTGADMPTVGGNLGNQHYSGLTQINQQNLHKLGPVWRTHVSAVPPATDDTGQQTTPIVADGVIYLDTPNGEVIAVDGKTGEANWKWAPDDFGTTGTRRGVSIGDGKVYTLAAGNRVVALDKDTGEEVWVVQPEAPDGASLGRIGKVATVYHDGVVYGHAADGGRGAVFALNSSDGSLMWHFFGGPDRGTIFTDVNGNSVDAAATWGPVLPDGTDCALEGGAAPWMHGSIDPELGMYYMT